MNEIVQEEFEIEKSAAKALRGVRQLLPEVPDDDNGPEPDRKGLFTTRSHTLTMESAIMLARQIDRAISELERPANRPGSKERLIQQNKQNGKSVSIVQLSINGDAPGGLNGEVPGGGREV